MENIQSRLLEMIQKADRQGANNLLAAWSEEHGYEKLLKQILIPTLQHIGEEWRTSENFSIAQSYVAAKIVEDALFMTLKNKKDNVNTVSEKGPVVIGNIEDDFHSLGRRMVKTFLEADGWIVYDLGNDVTAEEFVDTAVEIGARVIGASAMMKTTAYNIKKLRKELDRRNLSGHIQLAVGGAVFMVSPNLEKEIGSDGSSSTAIDAPELFDELWEASLQQETVHE